MSKHPITNHINMFTRCQFSKVLIFRGIFGLFQGFRYLHSIMTPVSGSNDAKKFLPVKVHPLFKDSFETLGSNLDFLLSGNSFKAFRFTLFTQKKPPMPVHLICTGIDGFFNGK
jgi:hypothetical protein